MNFEKTVLNEVNLADLFLMHARLKLVSSNFGNGTASYTVHRATMIMIRKHAINLELVSVVSTFY